jgi:regulation of enolase protein 1 (concanavalin A-like superfamily)
MSSNSRRAAARRRKHESQAATRQTDNPAWTVVWQEVQVLVDEEIQRLPSIYREAFILRCLENRSSVDVARSIGQNEATVRSRVARARRQLQKRLVQRGISLSAVLGCAAIISKTARAELPAALIHQTVDAALTWTPGTAATGLVTAEVAALVQGASRTALYAKAKLGVVLFLALGASTAGFGISRLPALARPLEQTEKQTTKEVEDKDVFGRAVTAELAGKPAEEQPPGDVDAKQVKVRVFDSFNGSWLPRWQPVRFDSSHLSLTKHPGQLTITTQRGSIYENHGARDEPIAKNLFVMANPASGNTDFTMTTSVGDFTPTAAYQQAALLVYDDDDNYLKYGYEYNHDKGAGQKIIVVCETDAHATYDHETSVSGLKRVWLRLTKRGNRYEYSASVDGKKFVVLGKSAWGNGAPKKVGIVAKNGGLKGVPEIDARFDFFEFVSPATLGSKPKEKADDQKE